MNDNKKRFSGFTLIELIIVLALFSVISVLVMSFIDPVSKLMGKTSLRERTASYVDNINEYLDKSMRYASFVRVFENDYCKGVDTDPITEAEAVENFVNDFYDGAIDSNGNPVTGQVHVLRLLNEPEKAGLPAGTHPGVIQEVIYSFTAGDSKPVRVVDNSTTPPTETISRSFETGYPSSSVTAGAVEDVINPEHFLYYSYNYALGFYEYVPVSAYTVDPAHDDTDSKAYTESLLNDANTSSIRYADTSGADIPIDSDYFYSELIRMKDNTGTYMTLGKDSFAVTVVAYPDDAKGSNRIICKKTMDDNSVEDTAIYKSPTFMNTSSMSLLNVSSTNLYNLSCFLFDQEVDTGVKKKDNGKDVIKPVNIWDLPFSHYKAQHADTDDDTSNIYFIFTVPSDINS